MKKVVSFALSVVLVFLLCTPVAALKKPVISAMTESAEFLNQLGIFSGNSNGFELERAPTRLEAVIMLVRLMGKVSDAMNCVEEAPFTDIPSWQPAPRYISYVYRSSLASGISASMFGTNSDCSDAQYATFLLRVMGYSDKADGDFDHQNALQFAGKVGFISADYKSTDFSRGDLAVWTENALFCKTKQGEALYESLLNAGAIPKSLSDFLASYADARVIKGDEFLTPENYNYEFEKEVLRLTNIERQKVGLSALTWNEEFAKVAREHSKNMALNDFFNHTDPEGLKPWDRLNKAGVEWNYPCGENIAAGHKTPEAVLEGWMNSPSHREAILNPDYSQLGVGLYQATGSIYGIFWTQVFGG